MMIMTGGGKKRGMGGGGRGGRGSGGKDVKEKKERKGKFESEVISVEPEALRELRGFVKDEDEIFSGGKEEKKEMEKKKEKVQQKKFNLKKKDNEKKRKRKCQLPLGLIIGAFLPPGSRQKHSNMFTNETKKSNVFSSSSSSSSPSSSSSANQNNQEIHIIRFAATPPLQWVEDVEVEDIREICGNEEEEEEEEEGKMKKKKRNGEKEELGRGGGGRDDDDDQLTVEFYLEYLQKHSGYSFSRCAAALVDWMSSHFRQIQRQLPGGLRVVGVWGRLRKDEEEDTKRVEEDEEEDDDYLEESVEEKEEGCVFKLSPCRSSNRLHRLLDLFCLMNQMSSSSSSSSLLSHFRFLAMSISSSSSSSVCCFDDMSVYSYDSSTDIPSSFSSPSSVSSTFKEVMMCGFSFPSNCCWTRGFCRLPLEVILCVILPTSRGGVEDKIRERRFGKDEEEMEENRYYLSDNNMINLSQILSKTLIDKYFSSPILLKFSSSASVTKIGGEEEEENEEEEEGENEKRGRIRNTHHHNRSIVVGPLEMSEMMISLREGGGEGLDEKDNNDEAEYQLLELRPLENHLSPIILTIVKDGDDAAKDEGDKRKEEGGWEIILEPSIFSLRNGEKGKENYDENENERNFCFTLPLNSIVGVSYFTDKLLLKELIDSITVDISSSLSFRIIDALNLFFENTLPPSSSECFSVRDHFLVSSSLSPLSFCEYRLLSECTDVSREALLTLMGFEEEEESSSSLSEAAALPSLCDVFSFSMKSGGGEEEEGEAKSSKGGGRNSSSSYLPLSPPPFVEQTRRRVLPNIKMSKKEEERHRYWRYVGLKLLEMGDAANGRMDEINRKTNCEKKTKILMNIWQIAAVIGVVGVGVMMMSERGIVLFNSFKL